MWDAVKEAIKTNGGTVRFIMIVLVLIAASAIVWPALGEASPGLFAAVARLLSTR
jgi:hypothetical protein